MISIPKWALDHCGMEENGYFDLSLAFGPVIVLKPHEGGKPQLDLPEPEAGKPPGKLEKCDPH